MTRLTLESGNIEPIRDNTRREAAKRRSGQCHAFRIHSFPRESLDNQLAEYYVFGNLRLQIEFKIKEKKRNFTSDRIGEHDKAGQEADSDLFKIGFSNDPCSRIYRTRFDCVT